MFIPESWKELITHSIRLANKCEIDIGSISAQLVKGYQNPNDVYSYFAPAVFIWDPLKACYNGRMSCL